MNDMEMTQDQLNSKISQYSTKITNLNTSLSDYQDKLNRAYELEDQNNGKCDEYNNLFSSEISNLTKVSAYYHVELADEYSDNMSSILSDTSAAEAMEDIKSYISDKILELEANVTTTNNQLTSARDTQTRYQDILSAKKEGLM